MGVENKADDVEKMVLCTDSHFTILLQNNMFQVPLEPV
jgi:hypothetical protein